MNPGGKGTRVPAPVYHCQQQQQQRISEGANSGSFSSPCDTPEQFTTFSFEGGVEFRAHATGRLHLLPTIFVFNTRREIMLLYKLLYKEKINSTYKTVPIYRIPIYQDNVYQGLM